MTKARTVIVSVWGGPLTSSLKSPGLAGASHCHDRGPRRASWPSSVSIEYSPGGPATTRICTAAFGITKTDVSRYSDSSSSNAIENRAVSLSYAAAEGDGGLHAIRAVASPRPMALLRQSLPGGREIL